MRYYRGSQFIPMKGNASMYYEIEEDGAVVRFMTVLPGGEIERMPNPPMRRLFRPDLLEEIDVAEFEKWWLSP